MGQIFTRAEHALRMWSITGVGLVGLLIKNSAESIPCKIVYFLRKRPITLSTWILTLEIFLVFSTSRGSSCFFPLVKAGITSSDLLKATLSCIVNPLSAMTMSPGTSLSRTPQFSVRNLSDVLPPQALDTKRWCLEG